VKPVKKQAATPTKTPDASTGASSSPAPPSASAGVGKLSATQHRKRQRQHKKQKAADAAAADLPPAFDPTVTLADSQSQAFKTMQTGPKPDFDPATEQAKPQKPAAVPAGNQPQTTSPSQPASKAVQSSVVAAGVDIQPPLVELESVVTTTAAEVVSSPGAVLAITWL